MADRTAPRAQPRRDSESQRLTTALRQARYEVLPVSGTSDEVERHLPRQLPVTVTASPRRGLDATLDLVETLAERGHRAVPHLAARSIVDDVHLADVLERLGAAGVEDAFVIAGDNPRPEGAFADAYSLLAAMSRLWRSGQGQPIVRLGVAGYPEGHPLVSREELLNALHAKQAMATYVVSQLCFDAETTRRWVRGLRGAGVRLPVYVGVAGAVDRRRLLSIAGRIGVGQSARFLRRHRQQVVRMVMPGGYRPSRLLRGLASAYADPELDVVGLHLYTFGNLAATELWRRRTLDRLGEAAS